MKFGQFILGLLVGGIVVFFLLKYSTDAMKSQEIARETLADTRSASAKWRWPDSLDAMVAAPKNHRLVYEDSNVRVLMVALDSKKSEPIHTHRWSSIMWIAKPIVSCQINNYKEARGTLVKTDSLLIKEMPINLGQLIGPETPTSITNLSNSNGEAYRIEFKKDFKN
ncbi:hypothetical protein OQZ33_13185 [Pedobacter sp. MC2016-05]|uniref:hypothetical protein n=1 Tax=Pedobacter sp. MC2016-05 TaxID=2994474 RepID=UPI0022482F90|nr:hypothetical protein [Pedobacter sp. MC2016-05]MCX2475284.1 hypothetical protein [Pedobacter sp. MC2016-05]